MPFAAYTTAELRARGRDLSDQTEDANSFDLYYHKREWTRIARFLLIDCDYTFDQAEQVLRSKYMRWASDACVVGDRRRMTLEKFAGYNENRKSIEGMLASECGLPVLR